MEWKAGEQCICSDHSDYFMNCEHCSLVAVNAYQLKAANKKLLLETHKVNEEIARYKCQIAYLEAQLAGHSAHETTRLTQIDRYEDLAERLLSTTLPPNLMQICRDPQDSLAFLLQNNIFKPFHPCGKCFEADGSNKLCKLMFSSSNSFSWQCMGCKHRANVKDGSPWQRYTISPDRLTLFLFLWSIEMRDVEIGRFIDMGSAVSSSMSKTIREIVAKHFCDNFTPFTGTVEVSEVNFFKRKIEIGKSRRKEKWVLGFIERETRRTYLEVIPARSKEHIMPIIKKRCSVGATILTEKWAGYGRLENYGYPHYTYERIVPTGDTLKDVHGRMIMLYFSWAKRDIKMRNRQGGDLQNYLHEFSWRKELAHNEISYRNEQRFHELLRVLAVPC
jgi:transposase-like protein